MLFYCILWASVSVVTNNVDSHHPFYIFWSDWISCGLKGCCDACNTKNIFKFKHKNESFCCGVTTLSITMLSIAISKTRLSALWHTMQCAVMLSTFYAVSIIMSVIIMCQYAKSCCAEFCFADSHYAESLYAECRNAECHYS
jgi:hypothetical protein